MCVARNPEKPVIRQIGSSGEVGMVGGKGRKQGSKERVRLFNRMWKSAQIEPPQSWYLGAGIQECRRAEFYL